MSTPEQLLTVGEAARLLSLTPDGVRHLERVGELAAQRTQTGVRLFRLDDVTALVIKRANAANVREYRTRR